MELSENPSSFKCGFFKYGLMCTEVGSAWRLSRKRPDPYYTLSNSKNNVYGVHISLTSPKMTSFYITLLCNPLDFVIFYDA